MEILYIDSETDTDITSIRAGWLKHDGHTVDVASGINVPFDSYDLVIVNLGVRNEQSDMREILANANIAGKRNNLGKNFLFTGVDREDLLFAKTHRAEYCHTYQLAQDTSRDAILEKATGTSLVRG